MFKLLSRWIDKFLEDEPTPEEIMEIRAREGTLLDDLHDAKEGAKEFLHELTEPDENDYIYACYDNEGLDEIVELDKEMIDPDITELVSSPFHSYHPLNLYYAEDIGEFDED